MKIIINADDFGLTRGVSLGILDSMEKGIVTSTTALVNSSFFEEGMSEAKKRGLDSIGIHLAMTIGKPVLPPQEIPNLVDDKGFFHKGVANLKELDYEEVRKELKAQIERFLEFNPKPTHLDGHHHFFSFHQVFLDAILDLAAEYNLPVRCLDPKLNHIYESKGVRTTEGIILDFYQDNVQEDIFKSLVLNKRDIKTVELMCHPAYVDEELMNISSYNTWRKEEYNILTSETVKEFLRGNGVELINFRDI